MSATSDEAKVPNGAKWQFLRKMILPTTKLPGRKNIAMRSSVLKDAELGTVIRRNAFILMWIYAIRWAVPTISTSAANKLWTLHGKLYAEEIRTKQNLYAILLKPFLLFRLF